MYPLPGNDPLREARSARRRRIGARSALAAGLAIAAMATPMFAAAGPGLAPSASQMGCDRNASGIWCGIWVGFNGVEGADSYTVSVRSPSGVVTGPTQVSGPASGRTGSPIAVRFSGSGAYAITISAFGTAPDGSAEKVAEDAASVYDEG